MPRPGVLRSRVLGNSSKILKVTLQPSRQRPLKRTARGTRHQRIKIRGAWVGGCQKQPAGVLGDTTSLATRTNFYHKPPPFWVEPDPLHRRAKKNPAAMGRKLVPRAASARTLRHIVATLRRLASQILDSPPVFQKNHDSTSPSLRGRPDCRSRLFGEPIPRNQPNQVLGRTNFQLRHDGRTL